METAPTFGQWVKQRRNELGLTQEQVAEATGYSPDTIRKIESGKRRPSHQVAEHLADLLQVEPQERRAFVLWARGLDKTGTGEARLPAEDEVSARNNSKSSPDVGRATSL